MARWVAPANAASEVLADYQTEAAVREVGQALAAAAPWGDLLLTGANNSEEAWDTVCGGSHSPANQWRRRFCVGDE